MALSRKSLSSVFDNDIYTIESNNAALIGSAYRAIHGHECLIQNKFIKARRLILGVFLKILKIKIPNSRIIRFIK